MDSVTEKTAMLDRAPSPARLKRGRAAVCLCPGQDRCGLCAGACGFGAIEKNGRVPQVDHAECIGCGACVKACPHGNMRLVDFTKAEDTAELTLKIPKRFVKNALAELKEGELIALFPTACGDHEGGRAEVLQAHYLESGELSLRVKTARENAFVPFSVPQTN